MDLDDLVAVERIQQLKARYFRLMDEKRWDEWRDVFTEDVVIDTSDDAPGMEPIVGRDTFVDFLAPMLEGVITCHHGHTPEIEITGPATATGVWAMEDHLVWPPEAGMGELRGSGWYHEQYRRGVDGQWRIESMTLRRIHVALNGQQTFPAAAP